MKLKPTRTTQIQTLIPNTTLNKTPRERNEPSASLRHYRSYLAIMKELSAAHLYPRLGHGTFYVPKHRLSMMPVINEHTQANALAAALMEEVNRGRPERERITEGLHLRSH
jgi:hypothetical protein